MNPAAFGSLNASLLTTRVEQANRSAPLLGLTTALARGDDAAWTQFHRDYGPRIFRQLLGATRGDHDLASEALQQTYLRVARHARPCDCEPMFLAWLRTVARSALSDCRRRQHSFWQLLSRRREQSIEADADGGSESDARVQRALDAALATLDVADRALLEAKYFAGIDVRTIADQLNITPKAAESRLTRARVELRRQITTALASHE